MYCLACNLQYPDHLNFCKHCGRPLARDEAGPDAEGTRCTRCGGRLIEGNNFCQQCGARVGTKTADTTIGTCHNCGTLWRSAWLYCKNCGMAKANALVAATVSPPVQSSIPTLTTNVYQPEAELSPTSGDGPQCPFCAAEVMPNSRFCEACGGKLKAAPTGDLDPSFVTGQSPEAETPTVEGPALDASAPHQNPPSSRVAPTLIDGLSAIDAAISAPTEPLKESKAAAGAHAETAGVGPARKAKTEAGSAAQPDLHGRTGEVKLVQEGHSGSLRQATVVTAISSPVTRPNVSPEESRLRRARAARQTAGIIGIALLLAIILTVLIIWRVRSKGAQPTTNSAVAQPSVQPSLATTPQPAPSPPASASIEPPEGMVYVPGGTFEMGRNDGFEEERPAHKVTVPPFFIDRTEVTNAQYQEFVKATGRRPPSDWRNGRYADGDDRLPVINVSWYDANEYAQWASKRLPREEEWEFAARGTDGRLYPWGQQWNQVLANTKESNNDRVVEVGHYSAGASPYGVLDMCGNVWEWTASNLISYADRVKELGDGKVIRGGGYNAPNERATTTYRGVVSPEKAYDKTGFRCVRDAR